MVSRKWLSDSEWYFLFSPKKYRSFSFNKFVSLALLNLNWAKNPETLNDPLNRGMAALMVLIAWASSAWYLRGGVKASGLLTAFAGIFQAWAALR